MNRTSQTFLLSVVRVGVLAIALVTLGGCASYIAHRIANPEANEIEAEVDLDDTEIVGSICVEGQQNCEID